MLWEKGERTERKPIRTRGDLSSAFRAKLEENLRNAEKSCQPQRARTVATTVDGRKNSYSINYQVTGGFCFLSSSVRRMSRNC